MRSARTGLCALHLVGDAFLLWLGYRWLSIPESDAGHLAFSACVIVLFVCGALWLHGTGWAFFSGTSGHRLGRGAGAALAHIPALFLLALLSVGLYAGVNWIDARLGNPSFQLASWLTMTIRKPIAPGSVLAVFQGIVWLVRWLILPAVLVPAAARVSVSGLRGLPGLVSIPRFVVAVKIFVLLLGAIWVPMRIMAWVPKMPNFAAEMASFLMRGALAYLLFAGLLLVLERATAAGNPALTQRSNSAMP